MLIGKLLAGDSTAETIGHSLCVAGGGVGADATSLHAACTTGQDNCLGLEDVGYILFVRAEANCPCNAAILLN